MVHGEAVDGKVDRGVDFAGGFGFAGGEAFEVDDEELWETGQDDLFGGFAFAFAVRAFPHFVAGEALLLRVGAEAVG